MWAASDSAFDIAFNDAKHYCENYRGGGYSDWRLPTLDELYELYKQGIRRVDDVPSQLITIHWRTWASEQVFYKDNLFSIGAFSFKIGRRHWVNPAATLDLRALPVRDL